MWVNDEPSMYRHAGPCNWPWASKTPARSSPFQSVVSCLSKYSHSNHHAYIFCLLGGFTYSLVQNCVLNLSPLYTPYVVLSHFSQYWQHLVMMLIAVNDHMFIREMYSKNNSYLFIGNCFPRVCIQGWLSLLSDVTVFLAASLAMALHATRSPSPMHMRGWLAPDATNDKFFSDVMYIEKLFLCICSPQGMSLAMGLVRAHRQICAYQSVSQAP